MSFVSHNNVMKCSELGEREVEFAGGELDDDLHCLACHRVADVASSCSNTECTGLWCERCCKSVTTCPMCSVPSVPHRNAIVIKQLKNKLVFCLHRVKREPAVVKTEPADLEELNLDGLPVRSQEHDHHDSKRVKVGSPGGVSFDETEADMMNPSSPFRPTGSVSFDSIGADRPGDVFMMDEAVAAGETEVQQQQPSSQMEESSYRSPGVVIVGMQGVNEQQTTVTLEAEVVDEPKLMDQCVPGEGEQGDGESELGKRKTEEVEQEGCVWVGQLGELANHLASSCPFEIILCGNHDCHEHVQRRDLTSHSAQCPHRPSTCLHCAHMVPFEALSEHESTCPKSPYVCMCGAKMLLEDEAAHQDQCPLTITPCEFSVHGCSVPVTRQDYAPHLRESCHDHASLISTAMSVMQAQMFAMREDQTKHKAEVRREMKMINNATLLIGSTLVMNFKILNVREKIAQAKAQGSPQGLTFKSDVVFIAGSVTQGPHALRLCVTFLPTNDNECWMDLGIWKEPASKTLKSSVEGLDLSGTTICVPRKNAEFPATRDVKFTFAQVNVPTTSSPPQTPTPTPTLQQGLVLHERVTIGFKAADGGIKDVAPYLVDSSSSTLTPSLIVVVTFKTAPIVML